MAGIFEGENKDAMIQGLLSLGGGILANNTGHYGRLGPPIGAGIQGFGRSYYGALQQYKDNELRKKQLEQMEALQQAQIGHYQTQDKLLKAQEEEKRRIEQDAAYDRGLTVPQQTQRAIPITPTPLDMPSITPAGFGPYKMPPNAQSAFDVLPNLTADQELAVANGRVVFGKDSSGPTLGTPEQFAEQEQIKKTGTLTADDVGVGGTSESGMILRQADHWKDLASKARTKEYRDQYYQNYRSAFDKYVDMVKQENAADTYQTVEGVPGVMRKKGSNEFLFNGEKISAEKVQEMHLANKKAGAINLEVKNTLSTEKKYGEQFAGKIAEQDSVMLDTANKAPDLAQRANSIKEIIASGKVITGAGADYRLALGKALGLVGMGGDKETIANTETLMVDMARNTLDAIKASGLGAGNGFSNADRDFLEKAAGGKISLESATIDRLATLAHRAAEKSAAKWNSRVKMIPKSAIEGAGISRDPISVPPLYLNKQQQPKPMIPKGFTVERVED